MLVTTKQKKKYLTVSNQELQLSTREEHIEVICNTKYLGVQMDEQSVNKKTSLAIGFLTYAKHFLLEAIVDTLFTLALLSFISNTGALFRTIAIPLTSYNCRGSKTKQHAS